MKAHATVRRLTMVALWASAGCPQLREDGFQSRVIDGGTTSGAGDGFGGSVAGRSGCTAGSGGCGSDAGSAGAESAGRAGASSAPEGDSGTDPIADCLPGEEVAPSGACYFVENAVSTWAEARTSCQARGDGWDLVTIGDAAQNDFVLSVAGFEAWIGATDGVEEGTWLWVNEDASFFEVGAATSAGFANWSDGEPNDYDDSDCLRILTTGEWADWPCDSPLGHVCGFRAP